MIDFPDYAALDLVRAAPDATDPVESAIHVGLGAGAGSAPVVLPAGCALERLQPRHRLRPLALVEPAAQPRGRHRDQSAHHAAEHERAQPRPPAPAVAHPITSRCAMKPAISRPIACTPVDAAPPADTAITTAGTT